MKKKKSKKDGFHIKLFINSNDETLLCRGRLFFLEAIDEFGSISGAARKMGYSYRKAWGLVEKTNRAAGRTIIETSTGGAGGGGAHLTEDGRKLAKIFRQFLTESQDMTNRMWKEYKDVFGE